MTTGIATNGKSAVDVQNIAPIIQHHSDRGELERRLPQQTFEAMFHAGLFRLWTPAEYGGRQADIPTFMRAIEDFSRVDGAAGWTVAIVAAGPLLTAYLPPEGAHEVLASGPDLPSPGSVIPNGRALPVSGGYRISGRWPLASGCDYGDWLSVTCLVFDGDAPRMGPQGAPDLHIAFVPRRDVQVLDTWHSLGMRGTGSTDITVEDAFVPNHRIFSLFGTPSQVAGHMYAAGPLVLFSMAVSSVLPGIARAAIDAFVELARNKTPTLSQDGLAGRPTIHAEVARAEAMLQSARAYVYEVAHELMASLEAGKGVPDELEASRRLACVNLATACRSVVDAMFTLAGSTPIYTGHRLERCLRDIHTAGQHLIVSPVWWEKTGQYYFGMGLGMP